MARPSGLTPEVQERIVAAVEAGASREAAAAAARVSTTTLYRWLQAGRDGDPGYRELWQEIKAAESSFEAENVAVIRKAAGSGTWQAAAWLLERKFADRYGVKHQLDVRVKAEIEEMLAHLQHTLPPGTFSQVLESLAGAAESLPAAEVLAIEAADPQE